MLEATLVEGINLLDDLKSLHISRFSEARQDGGRKGKTKGERPQAGEEDTGNKKKPMRYAVTARHKAMECPEPVGKYGIFEEIAGARRVTTMPFCPPPKCQ